MKEIVFTVVLYWISCLSLYKCFILSVIPKRYLFIYGIKLYTDSLSNNKKCTFGLARKRESTL